MGETIIAEWNRATIDVFILPKYIISNFTTEVVLEGRGFDDYLRVAERDSNLINTILLIIWVVGNDFDKKWANARVIDRQCEDCLLRYLTTINIQSDIVDFRAGSG